MDQEKKGDEIKNEKVLGQIERAASLVDRKTSSVFILALIGTVVYLTLWIRSLYADAGKEVIKTFNAQNKTIEEQAKLTVAKDTIIAIREREFQLILEKYQNTQKK